MITVQNLTFTYPGNTDPTVKDINFNIEKGEIFGFLGPSGAGKSTVQKVIIRLLKKFEGEIKVKGKDLRTWGADYYRHIGVGFELPNHYAKLTALENLRFFASLYDGKTRVPIELLQLVGLETDANKRVGDYSKGMKMRLNFIRALLHNPDIIFFDEPTGGLDPVNAQHIKSIILDLKKQGKTIFITTHNMYDADELCDRVAFIVDGQIALIESPKQLKLIHGERTVVVEYAEYLTGKFLNQEFSMDTLADNKDFLAVLGKEDIQSIHSKEATLNDVFIKVTGKSLS